MFLCVPVFFLLVPRLIASLAEPSPAAEPHMYTLYSLEYRKILSIDRRVSFLLFLSMCGYAIRDSGRFNSLQVSDVVRRKLVLSLPEVSPFVNPRFSLLAPTPSNFISRGRRYWIPGLLVDVSSCRELITDSRGCSQRLELLQGRQSKFGSFGPKSQSEEESSSDLCQEAHASFGAIGTEGHDFFRDHDEV